MRPWRIRWPWKSESVVMGANRAELADVRTTKATQITLCTGNPCAVYCNRTQNKLNKTMA